MKNARLLLIEDDRVDQLALLRFVEQERLPIQCTVAGSVREAKEILRREEFDVVISDYRLGDGDAFDILALNLDAQTIITTGAGNEEVAVKAMKAGAHDYLIKDVDRNYLKVLPLTVERAISEKRTRDRVALLTEKQSAESEIWRGEGLTETLKLIDLAAASDSPVVITGETGTGKNLVARAIHYSGPLRSGPFVSVNCAALPETLIEGELFGHEKGAFTSAITTKKGYFEVADGGTLLLDELGEMPFHLQSKLLGVLDDKKVRRLGSETARQVDVRLITATSIDLEQQLGKSFRQDLYYRLSVIRIALPPLRERRSDIPSLCRHLLKRLNDGIDVEIAEAELERLRDFAWPGNVRELKNILERALILHRGQQLRPSELLGKSNPALAASSAVPAVDAPLVSLEHVEREHIQRVLEHTAGNITQAARILGVSISTLKRKRKEYAMTGDEADN